MRRAAAVFALLAAPAAAAAQDAPETPRRPEGYREEARVERVIVDAYVTGSDGEPMPWGSSPAAIR